MMRRPSRGLAPAGAALREVHRFGDFDAKQSRQWESAKPFSVALYEIPELKSITLYDAGREVASLVYDPAIFVAEVRNVQGSPGQIILTERKSEHGEAS